MIDLGTGPNLSVLPAVTLSLDEMDFLLDTLALDTLPVVLDALPRHDRTAVRDEVFRTAADSLEKRNLLTGSTVHPTVAAWLRILTRPGREIALRWYIEGTVHRLCVAQGETITALAMKTGENYLVQGVGTDICAPVIAALGTARPMTFGSITAPTAQLGAVFDHSGKAETLTTALVGLGATEADAAALGHAMSTCTIYAEIIGIVYGDGRYDPVGGPVTVFDTRAGRIVGTSSVSAHGVAWSSLGPGTPRRLRRALESLVDQLSRPVPGATMPHSRGVPAMS